MARSSDQIYVYLEDEGVDVWRPAEAELLPDGSYRLLPSEDYDPEDERWQFPPGAIVECEPKRLSGGICLVAVRERKVMRRTA